MLFEDMLGVVLNGLLFSFEYSISIAVVHCSSDIDKPSRKRYAYTALFVYPYHSLIWGYLHFVLAV
jgi:hypothetical protein